MNSKFTISNGVHTDQWHCIGRTYQDFYLGEREGALGAVLRMWQAAHPEYRKEWGSPFKGGLLKEVRAAAPGLENGDSDQRDLESEGLPVSAIRGPRRHQTLQFEDLGTPPKEQQVCPDFDDATYADVTSASPLDYIWVAPETVSVRIGDIPNELVKRALWTSLLVCKELSQPFYHQIEQDIEGEKDLYMRLMLPVGDDQHKVSRIYIFCRSLGPQTRSTNSLNMVTNGIA